MFPTLLLKEMWAGLTMSRENRPLLTDEAVQFEKYPVEVHHQDFWEILPIVLEESMEYSSN